MEGPTLMQREQATMVNTMWLLLLLMMMEMMMMMMMMMMTTTTTTTLFHTFDLTTENELFSPRATSAE
jgi:hypothetical protein